MLTEQEKTRLFNSAIQFEPEYNPLLQHIGRNSCLRIGDENMSPGTICQSKIWLRTLGSDRSYELATYEITPHSLFVICQDLAKYPFVVSKTFLDCILEVTLPNSVPSSKSGRKYVHFMARIDKNMSNPSSALGAIPAGFVLKIIQITLEDINGLEAFIEAMNKVTAG